jgi:hypothetical protein
MNPQNNETRKEKSLAQKDRINFQKLHQIAKLISPDTMDTKYAIPGIIRWLRIIESMERIN